MTPEQTELVISSFRKLRPVADDVGRVFYARLFKIHPELRSIFRGDMEAQARALVAMMELIVAMLDMRDKVVPLLHYIGERHRIMGVRREYFQPFGDALIWTLAWFLPDEFTAETRVAWEEAYRFMADNMT